MSPRAATAYRRLQARAFYRTLRLPTVQQALRVMRSQTGWAEIGGRMIRATEDASSPDYGRVIGRTSWIPRHAWWAERPKGLSEAASLVAIDKALAGARLAKRQRAFVAYLAELALAPAEGAP